jgi:hypothetical protein
MSLTIMTQELFCSEMKRMDQSNTKGMLMLLASYIAYIDQKNTVRFTELSVKIDTLIAVNNAPTRPTAGSARASKVSGTPGNCQLFTKCPGLRMGNRTIATIMHLGSVDDHTWLNDNIPEELRGLPESSYINDDIAKAIANKSDAEKATERIKYKAGHIWSNMSKEHRASFHKNIKVWFSAHLVKYSKTMTAEDGDTEKKAGDDEQPQPKPTKQRAADTDANADVDAPDTETKAVAETKAAAEKKQKRKEASEKRKVKKAAEAAEKKAAEEAEAKDEAEKKPKRKLDKNEPESDLSSDENEDDGLGNDDSD